MGRDGDSTRVSGNYHGIGRELNSNRNYDEAIRVMQRASAIPKNTKISYHDHVREIKVSFIAAVH